MAEIGDVHLFISFYNVGLSMRGSASDVPFGPLTGPQQVDIEIDRPSAALA